MKSYKEKLIEEYKGLGLSDAELEKYRNITEANAKNLYYGLMRNRKGEENHRVYRDGAFVGYAKDEGSALKSAFC